MNKMTWDSSKCIKTKEGDYMNKKPALLVILLLVGLTLGGCVAVGGYGYGSGYDFSYGYYDYPHSYGYYNYGYGYPYRDNHRGWSGHRDSDGHHGSWGGSGADDDLKNSEATSSILNLKLEIVTPIRTRK